MTILNIDAIHGLQDMAPGSVDAIITDPPYCAGGVSESARVSAKGQGLRSENIGRFGWFVGDNMTTGGLLWLLRAVSFEAVRVLKPSGHLAVFCDWRQVHNIAPCIESAGLRYQGMAIWDKQSMGLGVGFRPQMEVILHFTNGKPEYHDRSVSNVLRHKRVSHRDRVHQTEKPVELMVDLVRVLVPKGGLVVDPFAGSGSTGVACSQYGCSFVGFERDPNHCEVATSRVATSHQMTEKAAGVAYESFKSQGWTDEQLVNYGYMVTK